MQQLRALAVRTDTGGGTSSMASSISSRPTAAANGRIRQVVPQVAALTCCSPDHLGGQVAGNAAARRRAPAVVPVRPHYRVVRERVSSSSRVSSPSSAHAYDPSIAITMRSSLSDVSATLVRSNSARHACGGAPRYACRFRRALDDEAVVEAVDRDDVDRIARGIEHEADEAAFRSEAPMSRVRTWFRKVSLSSSSPVTATRPDVEQSMRPARPRRERYSSSRPRHDHAILAVAHRAVLGVGVGGGIGSGSAACRHSFRWLGERDRGQKAMVSVASAATSPSTTASQRNSASPPWMRTQVA